MALGDNSMWLSEMHDINILRAFKKELGVFCVVSCTAFEMV